MPFLKTIFVRQYQRSRSGQVLYNVCPVNWVVMYMLSEIQFVFSSPTMKWHPNS